MPLGDVLRLLSGGAAGAILMALDEGALQTKVLTYRVRGYTARTVYRYLPKLARLGAVERDHRPKGRTKVVHTLNGDGGSELCNLIGRFATASMTRLPSGQIEPTAWASLGSLADLWEAGVVDELSREPKSAGELARGLDGLSYHQLARRASRFKTSGFFAKVRQGNRSQYTLTDKARRTMGFVAGLDRWRQRHLDAAGLTLAEMATVLRVALPLAVLPDHIGSTFRVSVSERSGGGTHDLYAEVGGGGAVEMREVPSGHCDCWVEGTVADWLAALLDSDPPLSAGGEIAIVENCLTSIYERLWTPSPF